MKKTIPTTLSGILFYIEEDAYNKLKDYLDSIKNHFASYADSDEIVSDIENRIAEQFSENQSKNKNKENIVTLANVESLIASMGNVKDFSEETEKGETHEKTGEKEEILKKKLFRNPDDVIIAGVASGLAAYFGIDATIVRIIFILVVLFGGSGVLIYIILWLIVPEAKTSTEKLQMRGEKITLESVKELTQEKINEVKENPRTKNLLRKIIRLPFIIIGKIFKIILPIIRKIIGIAVTIVASLIIFVNLFVLAVAAFNIQSPYIDFPFLQIGHHLLIFTMMFAIFFVVFIPAVFLLLLGTKIFGKAKVFHHKAVLSLLGVWCISVTLVAAIGVRLAPEYQEFLATNPTYRETTTEFPLENFTAVSITNGNRVSLSEGDQFKVSATGVSQSIDDLEMKVEDNVLFIDRKNHFRICIFCRNNTPEIYVSMPKVSAITLKNGSRVKAEDIIISKDLSVKISNGSRADLSSLDLNNLSLEVENASRASLSGKADVANFKISNASDASGIDLEATDATVTLENGSRASIRAVKSIDVNLKNGSFLFYEGNPTIEKKISNGSRLEKK